MASCHRTLEGLSYTLWLMHWVSSSNNKRKCLVCTPSCLVHSIKWASFFVSQSLRNEQRAIVEVFLSDACGGTDRSLVVNDQTHNSRMFGQFL